MTEANRAFYDRISHAYDFIADSNEHKARLHNGLESGTELSHFEILSASCLNQSSQRKT